MKKKNRQRKLKERQKRRRREKYQQRMELHAGVRRAKPEPEQVSEEGMGNVFRSINDMLNSSIALSEAIKAGEYDCLKCMLEEDRSGIDMWNWDGVPPIIEAVRPSVGSAAYLDLLLEKGADPNREDIHDRTALIFVTKLGRVSMARMLVEAGGNPEKKDSHGKNAYDYANELEPNFRDAMKAALFVPRDNADHLYKAITEREVNLVHYWLEDLGVDPNQPSGPDNIPPLVVAVGYKGDRSLRIVELLLKHGACPLGENNNRETAFMIAMKSGNPEMFQLVHGHVRQLMDSKLE